MTTFSRAFVLDDIQVRSDGTGRTVEAYAAVFDTPTAIRDSQGHYMEQIAPRAFNKTVADRGTRFGVFYNHGKTLFGTPSERASIPLGSPIEPPRADGRGLITVTRYNKTPQADEVLEAIRNGDIRGQSFSGRFIDSTPRTPARGFAPSSRGDLTLVTRTEIAMTEYGPTPIPAYDVPMVVGVRSRQARGVVSRELQRLQGLIGERALTPEDTAVLSALLARLAAADAALDPIVDALTAADCGLDDAQMTLAALLGVPNPDPDADEEADSGAPEPGTDGTTSGGSSGPGRSTATPAAGAGAEEPRTHSGRLHMSRLRWEARQKGVLS